MNEENRRVLGAAYFYTAIRAVFVLLSLLEILVVAKDIAGQAFLRGSIVLFIPIIVIVILSSVARKNHKRIADLLSDYTVRKTVGTLILIDCLISLIPYAYLAIHEIAMICKGTPDENIVPYGISLFLILCQIIVALYLLKNNRKNTYDYEAKTVLGIAYLYAAYSTLFSLLEKVFDYIGSGISFDVYSLLWYVLTAAILITLFILNKKQNQSYNSMFEDNTIRKTVGFLMVFIGVTSLPSLYNNFSYIHSLIRMGESSHQIHSGIIQTVSSVINIAGQIAFGTYLLRKSKQGGELITKIVLELIYIIALIVIAFVAVTKLVVNTLTGDNLTAYYSLWIFAAAAIIFIFARLCKKK